MEKEKKNLNIMPETGSPKRKLIDLRPAEIDIRDEAGSLQAEAQYLDAIGAIPRIASEEEMLSLVQKIQLGKSAEQALLENPNNPKLRREQTEGRYAWRGLVEANLRWVVTVARGYKNTISLEILDFVQLGNIGLMEAAERYDPEKGSFSNYSKLWIDKRIREGIADTDRIIRRPRESAQEFNKIIRASRELEMTLGREPSLAEIFDKLEGTTLDRVEFLIRDNEQNRVLESVDRVLEPESEVRIIDTIADEDPHVYPEEVVPELDISAKRAEVLAQAFTPRQLRLAYRHFADGLNYTEVAEEAGIARPTAAGILKRIKAKIEDLAPELLID